MHGEEAGGGLSEPVGAEDLRPDVAVEPDEVEPGMRADARHGIRRVAEGDAELLVFVRRRQEGVSVGVDAAVDAQPHPLNPTVACRRLRDPLDLLEAVDHDSAHADRYGPVDLVDRLVVAVEPETCWVDVSGERDRKLAAAAHVDVEARPGHPPCDLDTQERLARVVDLRRRPDARESGRERIEDLSGAFARMLLVDDIERCSVLRSQGADRHSADRELAVRPRDGSRPERR